MVKDGTYCAIVTTEDVLGRTVVGRSNCVTVYLDKPQPGTVGIGSTIEVHNTIY